MRCPPARAVLDPLDRDVALGHAGVERQAREQRQLLGRVAAGDVHRRIGLGVAQLLRLGQRLRVGPAVVASCG